MQSFVPFVFVPTVIGRRLQAFWCYIVFHLEAGGCLLSHPKSSADI
jgi:hypothetical protein